MTYHNKLIENLKSDISKNLLESNFLKDSLYGVYLFGSIARGYQKQSQNSDIDLLILSKTNHPDLDFFKELSVFINSKINKEKNLEIEVAFITLEEIPLLVSPVLAKSWSKEAISLYGESIDILQKLILSKIDDICLLKSVVRRQQFNQYLLRQSLIVSINNASTETLSSISRTIAKQIIWSKRAELFLNKKNAFDYTYTELIQLISQDNTDVANTLDKILIEGKSIFDALELLYTFLGWKNSKNLSELKEILTKSKQDIKDIFILDPL